ncbi:MAG TPA: histidine phosphatase family protein [Sphingobium sp.]|nr:histidine phosphatase family protein [Sphingobium sp.]
MLMLATPRKTEQTCFHLVRHGAHDELGRVLSGRAGTIALNEEGSRQAEALSRWAGQENISAVYASPRARTLETASIIAAAAKLKFEIASELDELDFGEWNGKSFIELNDDPLWHEWNKSRSTAATPGGETMAEAIDRSVAFLLFLADAQPGSTFLCVTHCDIIRGIVAYFLGLSFDNILKFDVQPGSISTVLFSSSGGCVSRLNEVPA